MRSHFFISHASEDKDAFVRPLAHALKKLGLSVWYDEFSLKTGESLRRSLDKGLSECEAGVVVLSKSFFLKEWPQRELDALLNADVAGDRKLYPIWHEIDVKYVASISPLLADKIAIMSHIGVECVADKLAELASPISCVSNARIAETLGMFLSQETYVLEYLHAGCMHRFLQIQAFNTEFQQIADSYFNSLSDDEVEEKMWEIEALLEPHKHRLISKYNLPQDVEVVPGEPIPDERLSAWMKGIEEWVYGTLDPEESSSLILDLDNYVDVDYLYILFGLPNYGVSPEQRKLLNEASVLIGSWVEAEKADELLDICEVIKNIHPN